MYLGETINEKILAKANNMLSTSRPLLDKDSFHVSDSLVGGEIGYLLQVSLVVCLGSYARRERPKMRLFDSKFQLPKRID